MSAGGVVVLYSGGTDSTLAATLVAPRFERLHLVTYRRFGLHAVERARVNAAALQARFGAGQISHEILDVERIFTFVSYERYLRNLFRHGFYLLSTCGLCKLAMHIRTVQYCLENGIRSVCDGANRGMPWSSDQMKCVLEEVEKLYSFFGIHYFSPVFDLPPPPERSLLAVPVSELLPGPAVSSRERSGGENKLATPGELLYRIGLAPAPDVKGTAYDRARQPRCLQLILFNVFSFKWCDAVADFENYERRTRSFFADKVQAGIRLLQEHRETGKHRRMFD